MKTHWEKCVCSVVVVVAAVIVIIVVVPTSFTVGISYYIRFWVGVGPIQLIFEGVMYSWSCSNIIWFPFLFGPVPSSFHFALYPPNQSPYTLYQFFFDSSVLLLFTYCTNEPSAYGINNNICPLLGTTNALPFSMGPYILGTVCVCLWSSRKAPRYWGKVTTESRPDQEKTKIYFQGQQPLNGKRDPSK